MFQNAPEDDLVDLAIDLDVPVPEEIDLAGMLDSVVRNLADLGKREGLPFSRYDQEDLEQLTGRPDRRKEGIGQTGRPDRRKGG